MTSLSFTVNCDLNECFLQHVIQKLQDIVLCRLIKGSEGYLFIIFFILIQIVVNYYIIVCHLQGIFQVTI